MAMRSAESIFLSKLDTLFRLVQADDTSSLIDVCAILRLLLLDKRRLIDEVKKQHRVELRFEVGNMGVGGFPPVIPIPTIQTIDPTAIAGRSRSLSLDEFLAFECAVIQGESFTVKELIRYGAHVLGAVHAGVPEEKEKRLEALHALRISNKELLAELYRSVGLIVLDALRELRHSVLRLTDYDDKPGLSIHLCVTMYPIEGDHVNFILDIGVTPDRNRVSLFIDSTHHLTLRVIDADGKETRIRAMHGRWLYSRQCYVNAYIGRGDRDTVIGLQVDDRDLIRVEPNHASDSDGTFHFVLGSDVTGDAHTHLMLHELMTFSNCPSLGNRIKTREFVYTKIAEQKYQQGVHFRSEDRRGGENQFLHSPDHPNFPGE